MKVPGSVKLTARLLQEALAVVVPKHRKNSRQKNKAWPVTLELDNDRGVLEVSEAEHALKSYQIVATGTWPGMVQVEGQMLRKIVDKYDANDCLELVATHDELCILRAGSIIQIRRIDADGRPSIKRRPIPPDPRHTGPVEFPPDPVGKRVELNDTWLFSARVPMPQHRDPEEQQNSTRQHRAPSKK